MRTINKFPILFLSVAIVQFSSVLGASRALAETPVASKSCATAARESVELRTEITSWLSRIAPDTQNYLKAISNFVSFTDSRTSSPEAGYIVALPVHTPGRYHAPLVLITDAEFGELNNKEVRDLPKMLILPLKDGLSAYINLKKGWIVVMNKPISIPLAFRHFETEHSKLVDGMEGNSNYSVHDLSALTTDSLGKKFSLGKLEVGDSDFESTLDHTGDQKTSITLRFKPIKPRRDSYNFINEYKISITFVEGKIPEIKVIKQPT